MGSRDDLEAGNKRERAAHPEGEAGLYAGWQQSQYIRSMFSAQHHTLDNNRSPDLRWTALEGLLKP